jgi:hypothetical protein
MVLVKFYQQSNVSNGNAFRDLVAQQRPDKVGLYTVNTNWQDLKLSKIGFPTQHNLTARGPLLSNTNQHFLLFCWHRRETF